VRFTGPGSPQATASRADEAVKALPANRVLIAEDDPIYLEMARFTLDEAGFSVTTAGDGAIAASAVAQSRFDIIIADIEMPLVGGLDVVRLARAGGPNASTPIIIMTGHDDPATTLAAYKAGTTAFLAKPIDWQTFAINVRTVLQGHQQNAEQEEDLAVMRRWLGQDSGSAST
jgi:DNA-binding response OmpR family regulator